MMNGELIELASRLSGSTTSSAPRFEAEEVSPTGGRLLKDIPSALRFMTAGKACVTLRSRKTGARFTYRINESEDGKMLFVALLTGSDNNSSYKYLGTIPQSSGAFVHGRKSKISAEAPGSRAFAWAWRVISERRDASDLEVYHEGMCGRCGRRLTVPESIESGFGPECAGRVS